MPQRDIETSLQEQRFAGAQRGIGDAAARGRGQGREPSGRELAAVVDHPRDKGTDDRIHRAVDDPKSLAGSVLGRNDHFHDALQRISPEERLNNREQLIAEVLQRESFCKEGYLRASEGRATSWDQLYPSEKLAVFKDAEHLTARIEGREPCKVTPSESDANGGFDPESRTIDLDHSKTMSHSVSEKEAMGTFFHEQAHALQLAAVKNPEAFPEFSASQINEWKENFKPENYKPGGERKSEHIAYRDQPVERNAREMADGVDGRKARLDEARRRNEI